MKKAALHNLGCKVNEYETQSMQQMLIDDGYEIVPFTSEADVYVINTCSVTNIADQKSRQMIHRARKQNPHALIVACGCYVQTANQSQKLQDLHAYADIIIGNNKKHELISLLHLHEEGMMFSTDDIIDINQGNQEYEELICHQISDKTRAFIKIQDGCNQFCSYCIIPFARGRIRSRELADVMTEVRTLAENGYQEVVLSGIHISSYKSANGVELIDLIEAVNQVDGIQRIRLGSMEPMVITEDFVYRLARIDKICPQFHLSLQSGCDETLQRMNRKYTLEEFTNSVALLRKAFSSPAITTDIIVGFPGETEEEFDRTKEYLHDIQFYELHVFPFSKREGTKAAVMPNQLPNQEKSSRARELILLGQQYSVDYRKAMLDKEVSVLFEDEITLDGVSYQTGYTKEYIKVITLETHSLHNQIVKGRITGMYSEDLCIFEREA